MLGSSDGLKAEIQGLKHFHLSYDTFPATWADTYLSAKIGLFWFLLLNMERD